MNQAENIVSIQGILSEVDIKTGQSKKDGKPYIMGEIKVKVEQDVNGQRIFNEIPVSLFATKMTKKGTINPAYESIEKVMNTFTSIASCGDEDKADRVRIDRAELCANEFYAKNGNLISMPRIRASFINKIKKEECVPTAKFTNVIVVGSINDELNRDGEPTGRLKVTGILPLYGDKVDVIDFVVGSENAIQHIKSYYNAEDTVRIAGKVNFTVKTVSTETEVGFGEPIIETHTVSVRELMITSGSPSALEDGYTKDEITTALKERQARLEKLKEEATKPKTAAAGSAGGSGFGEDLGF